MRNCLLNEWILEFFFLTVGQNNLVNKLPFSLNTHLNVFSFMNGPFSKPQGEIPLPSYFVEDCNAIIYKVIIDNSRGEVSLLVQDTIENVS